MYFIFYFFISILLLLFILTQFFNILSQSNKDSHKKYMNILIFLIFFSTIAAVIINVYSIKKNHNKIGNQGDRGIDGAQGNPGTKSKCNSKCGQKICYLDVVKYANEVFNKEVKRINENKHSSSTTKATTDKELMKIQNKNFLQKLQKICLSDEYYKTLTKEHKNKPSEHKLINYIKNIVSKWVVLILYDLADKDKEESKGYRFLSSPAYDFDYLKQIKINNDNPDFKTDAKNVYEEIRKYDIFRWGEDPVTKKEKYYIKSDTLSHPQPDVARINIIKTNNYNPVYNSEPKKDIWDAENCPYNQMGSNLDNPNNLDKCVYIDKNNYTKSYQNTWKNTEYKVPQELSLYNVDLFKNKQNQKFYPIGSVWRGKTSYEKPKHSVNTPDSSSFCGDGHGHNNTQQHTNKGPEKETILVSGDVKSPVGYKKIWDSKQKCPECQINHTQIFRPIPPEGYKCLGDVAIPHNDNRILQNEALNDLEIKCLPDDCLKKVNLGNKVWDNKDFSYGKYSNYINYTSKVPYKTNRQLGASIWDAGSSGAAEEILNNYGVELVENGGYNLFRTNNDIKLKPKQNSYLIKDKCLIPGGGKIPKKIQFNLDSIKEKIKSTDGERYKTDKYFGENNKPPMAILTNLNTNFGSDETKNLNNINNQPKKVYLVDDGHKRGGWVNGKKLTNKEYKNLKTDVDKYDTFIIKVFNPEKNDFSSCLYYNDSNDIIVRPYCSLNSKYNKWVVDYDTPNGTTAAIGTTNNMKMKNKEKVNIRPELNSSNSYKLISYYDNLGKDHFELVKDSSGLSNFNWLYETPVIMNLPIRK